MEPFVAAAAAAVLLLGLWVAANRRHLDRRRGQTQEWAGAGRRPDLWTSAARCPSCGQPGGLLSADQDGEALWFTCLACGQRHRREHKG